MSTSARRRPRRRLLTCAAVAAALVIGPAVGAGADPISAGEASAFGATVTAGGETVVPPTPQQSASLPGDEAETVVNIPADPIAISGTLTADAAVHAASDLPTTLVTEGTAQSVEGPYNARAEGVVEELDVLLDAAGEGVSLLRADVVRAEAVGVCRGDTVEYSATSELVGLTIGGQQVPVNAPVQDLVDAIGDVLEETGLNQVVDVQRNVVTTTATGASVDALVVTVLAAAGDDPLAQVRIAHAEVGGLTCGEAAAAPECSDGADNDGDTLVDFPADPGCDSPEDDSELDAPVAAPDAGSPAPAAPVTDSTLPRTGGGGTVALVAGSLLAAGAYVLRRFGAASIS